jgi:hypothetical protein
LSFMSAFSRLQFKADGWWAVLSARFLWMVPSFLKWFS